MIYKCILVKSVTYAQKSKKLLEKKGISSYISKQTFSPKYGCAWCVKVSQADLARSLSIMREENIKMTGDIHDV